MKYPSTPFLACPFPSCFQSFRCLPGWLGRFLSFLFSSFSFVLFSFFFPVLPLACARPTCLPTKGGEVPQVLSMCLFVLSPSPGFLFIAAAHLSSFFLSCLFCLQVLSFHSFLLLCARCPERARSHANQAFRFFKVVPVHWVLFHFRRLWEACVCVCVCGCVCVCNPWNHRDPSDCFELLAGGARDRASLALTKTLALVCEIDLGRQIDVPAIYHFSNGERLSPEPHR